MGYPSDEIGVTGLESSGGALTAQTVHRRLIPREGVTRFAASGMEYCDWFSFWVTARTHSRVNFRISLGDNRSKVSVSVQLHPIRCSTQLRGQQTADGTLRSRVERWIALEVSRLDSGRARVASKGPLTLQC